MPSSPYDVFKHITVQDIHYNNLSDALKHMVSMKECKFVLFKKPIERFDQVCKHNTEREGDVLVGFYANHGDVELVISSEFMDTGIIGMWGNSNISKHRLYIRKPNHFYYAHDNHQVINLIACNYNTICIRNESNLNLPPTTLWAVYAIIDSPVRRMIAGSGNLLTRVWKPIELENIAAKMIQSAWRKAVSDPSYLTCQRRLKWEFEGIQNPANEHPSNMPKCCNSTPALFAYGSHTQ
jgi:hypothetical protein